MTWGVFFILLATYWLTVAPTVSFWDCPEYVSAAWRLEVGHPPGNPTWMLVERVVTMLAPSGREAALLVNLSSGLFTAFAAFFLAKTIFAAAGWVLDSLKKTRYQTLQQAVAAAAGSLAFGWCDSVWYSAIEAEVYAMSVFMTSLCLWLMVKWALCSDPLFSKRLLILLAYIFGLSLGVHQLNLLCIPALAVIWCIKHKVRGGWRIAGVLLLSMALVGIILVGIMPGTINMAARCELFAVNTLGLPFLSGVPLFLVLTAALLLIALFLTSRRHTPLWRTLNMGVWMFALLLTGYSTYALIPIRGNIPSPANSGFPGNPFSFASYLAREQYGGSPLLYGHTPMSKPMVREEFQAGSDRPRYRFYELERKHPLYVPVEEDGVLHDPYNTLDAKDSAFNRKALKSGRDAYVVRSYTVKPMLTPELNMWFPRITSRDPSDLACFYDWAGMDTASMKKVQITEAIDSMGRAVNKIGADGKRHAAMSRRPTYAQSLRMLATYQIGYMYFRYLLWNFMGRQNDYHSTGEVEHGNFITGILPLDNAMLGAEDALPDTMGRDNCGRNRYFLLPFLLGIAGIFVMLAMKRRGRMSCLTTTVLFIMTGLAIVVYLNQSPGEPRERDYSFLGSYLAFAVWIGFGALGLVRVAGKYAPAAACVPLAAVVWMCVENYDDHDRSGRYAASRIPANVLNSLPPDAILFVNGDNATFPFWYSQEVEGIRRDVRVVNLAYLALPQYATALMADWDGADAIATTLERRQIVYGALQLAGLSVANHDSTASAAAMLRALGNSDDAKVRVDKVWLKISPSDSVLFPLRNLQKSERSSSFDFGRLMMFDIIATNSDAAHPRPIVWHRSLPARALIGLDTLTTSTLFGFEFGKHDGAAREKAYLKALSMLQSPNDLQRNVYLDPTPANQVSAHRASLVLAAQDMLHAGRLATARRLAEAADSLLGADTRTYGAIRNCDTLFNTRPEMARLFRELADSMSVAGDPRLRKEASEMRRRAAHFEAAEEIANHQWKTYYRTLPPSLRLKVGRR